MSRVFVIQRQMRRDRNTGELVLKFNLEPAEKFGEIVYLLSPTAGPFNPGPIIQDLHEALHDYSDDDFLLLIGNPCLIGWSVGIAAHHNAGRVRLLQWSNRPEGNERYVEVEADLGIGGCSTLLKVPS